MFILIKNANLFDPQPKGIVDILLAGEKIAAIEANLDVGKLPGLSVLDAGFATVVPGFIDGHVHLVGGGGEGGFATRTPEVPLSKLTMAGVTTVVGLLGTDRATRHNASLYAKTKGLTEEGITAYMFTGGYAIPTCTVTGSVHDDIVFLDTVIGLKLAISDHRSSVPSLQELQRLVSDARVAGLISKKCGRVVAHLGSASGGLDPLYEVLHTTEVPIEQFIPTHVNRKEFLFEQAMDWVEKGGFIDLTSGINPDMGARGAVKPSQAMAQCIERGLDLNKISISSDGHGSIPHFDASGKLMGLVVAGFESLLGELRDMVSEEGLSLQQALMPYTVAPANVLGLSDKKGQLKVGMDADMLCLSEGLNLQHTIAKGQLMVKDGQVQVRGTFE